MGYVPDVMRKSVYDVNDNQSVDSAESATELTGIVKQRLSISAGESFTVNGECMTVILPPNKKFSVEGSLKITNGGSFILFSLHDIKMAYEIVAMHRAESDPKTIDAGASKYLEISGGPASIVGITIDGVVGYDWTLEVYVPAKEGVTAPAPADRRDIISYTSSGTKGGLIVPFAMPYNCFLKFTNDGSSSQTINKVTVVYRSKETLTLSWEE